MTLGAEMAETGGARASDLAALLAWPRRHALALAGALGVNLVLVSLIAFTPLVRPAPESPEIDVILVGPPVMPQGRKPKPPTFELEPARPRPAVARPDAPPPEARPLPLPPTPAAPPSRWSANDDRAKPLFGDLDRAVVPNFRQGRDCLNGRLDRLPAGEREACERRWAKFKPQGGTDKPLYALKDPGGEWGRVARRQEDKRKPLTQAPVHACYNDKAMSNLASGCTD